MALKLSFCPCQNFMGIASCKQRGRQCCEHPPPSQHLNYPSLEPHLPCQGDGRSEAPGRPAYHQICIRLAGTIASRVHLRFGHSRAIWNW